MTPQITFARGLARLLLVHARDLTPEDRAYIQTVADATTEDQMQACWRAAAYAAASAYASAYAAACGASDYAAAYWTEQACTDAVKAGVPEDAVAALRALTLGDK